MAPCMNSDRTPRTEGTWVVSHNKRFRANIIVWGFSRDKHMDSVDVNVDAMF